MSWHDEDDEDGEDHDNEDGLDEDDEDDVKRTPAESHHKKNSPVLGLNQNFWARSNIYI